MPDANLEVQLHVREVRLGPFTILIVRAVPWWAGIRSSLARWRVGRLAKRVRMYIEDQR